MTDLAAHVSRLTVSQHLSMFVDKVLTNDLLFDIIFDACSPASLARISRTCRIAYGTVQYYISRAYDVNALLSRYFPDPLGFRSLQRRTGALVSGSTALQLFLRERYPESDLDVYVRKDAFEEVARWVFAQGYIFIPSQSQDALFEVAISQEEVADEYDFEEYITFNVLTFVKPLQTHPEQQLKVQIIGAVHTPMENILKFHSSTFLPLRDAVFYIQLNVTVALVMNVIAWDYAYCLYPSATLESREAVFTGSGLSQVDANKFRRKYAARGLTILSDTQRLPTLDRVKFGGNVRRLVGDKYTWALRLPIDNVAPLRYAHVLLRDPCVCTAWALEWNFYPRLETTVLEEERLQFSYVDYGDHLGFLLWQELEEFVKRKKKKR